MKMIIGTGIDITELERIEKMVQRQSAFITRILTKNERERYEKLSSRRKVEFLAGRFAVKEAYSKALGTGIGKDFSFQDIEVVNDERGKPHIVTKQPLEASVHVSISHSAHYAIAQVIIERLSS